MKGINPVFKKLSIILKETNEILIKHIKKCSPGVNKMPRKPE